MKKKKKNDKLVFWIASYISHDEFVSVNNVLR